MPAVSVIIPVFNAGKYLPSCLDSVCGQTLGDLEIICIDDGSTDASPATMQDYAARDARVRIITFPQNRGVSAARNAGIDAATGDYLGFVDGDDTIDPDFYEKLYSEAHRTGAEVVKGDILAFDPETGKDTREDWLQINHLVRRHKAYFHFTFTTAIWSRRLLVDNGIRFPEGLGYFEDPCFTMQAALYYDRLSIVDDALYHYTQHRGSATRSTLGTGHVDAVVRGSELVLDMMAEANVDGRHFEIVLDCLVGQLKMMCQRPDVSDEVTAAAADGIDRVLIYAGKDPAGLKERFLARKAGYRRSLVEQLKLKLKR